MPRGEFAPVDFGGGGVRGGVLCSYNWRGEGKGWRVRTCDNGDFTLDAAIGQGVS